MKALLAQVQKLEVLYKGQAIISGSLTDLMMLSYLVTGAQPYGGNFIKTNNDVRWITVTVPFGRAFYSLTEAFPGTRKGELQLQITYAAAQTGIDTVIAQIETVELLDASPVAFLKYTTQSKTPSSTGWHDVDLPIGNDILGALLYATTVPTGSSFNSSIGQIKLLVDNVEYGYSFANWESCHGELLVPRSHLWLAEHFHRGESPASWPTEFDTGIQEEDDTILQNYVYLEYDPLKNGEYAVKTTGHSRVNLRINQEPSADAIRVLPVELVRVGQAA
jgi:hypothetical protein